MPDDVIHVLSTGPCELCSTGLYQRKMAVVQTATKVGAATARLCMDCADLIGTGWRTPLIPVADDLPLLDDADATRYLEAQRWTTARTAPEYPHAYVLLSRSADPLTHLRTVRLIRLEGERRQWTPATGPAAGRKVWCHYWRSGPFEYWTQPSLADPILNRAERPE